VKPGDIAALKKKCGGIAGKPRLYPFTAWDVMRELPYYSWGDDDISARRLNKYAKIGAE
jgi:hypothetical protein